MVGFLLTGPFHETTVGKINAILGYFKSILKTITMAALHWLLVRIDSNFMF